MKKVMFVVCLTLSVMVFIAGCTSTPSTPESAAPESTASESVVSEEKPSADTKLPKKGEGLVIKHIPMGVETPYWDASRLGAEEAAAAHAEEWGGIEVLTEGAPDSNIEQQINIVNNTVASGVDGILVAPLSSEALTDCMNNSANSGVVTVCFDNILDDMETVPAFFGTDSIAMNASMATYMIDKVIPESGTYYQILPNMDMKQMQDRYAGFVDTMKEKAPDWKDGGFQTPGTTVDNAMNVTQNLIAGGDVDMLFCASDFMGLGAMNAIKALDMGDEIFLCSVDCNAELLEGLRDGTVDCLALQMPYNEGYMSVEAILTLLEGGTVEKSNDTGSFILTKDNMDTEEGVKAIQQYISGYTAPV